MNRTSMIEEEMLGWFIYGLIFGCSYVESGVGLSDSCVGPFQLMIFYGSMILMLFFDALRCSDPSTLRALLRKPPPFLTCHFLDW